MSKKLTPKQYILLTEALRRYVRFGKPEDKTLANAWTGLGTVTEYKPVLKSGMMQWVNGVPSPRCMGWLKLAPLGEKIVQKWLDDGYTNFKDLRGNGWEQIVNSDGKQPSWDISFLENEHE